jgi:hypothetical protein
MKNLFKLCVIFMTTSIFLTSCGSSLSITKRQHSKGYFVSYDKKYSTTSTKVNSTESDVKNQVAIVEKAKEVDAPLNASTEVNTTLITDGSTISNTNLKEESVTDVAETATISKKKVEQNTVKQPRTIKSAKKNVQSMITSVDARDSSDGYSLLWIIIIILLVLWALGLIGGLGSTGLLHILLVIALILLILWLLRVI